MPASRGRKRLWTRVVQRAGHERARPRPGLPRGSGLRSYPKRALDRLCARVIQQRGEYIHRGDEHVALTALLGMRPGKLKMIGVRKPSS